MKFFRGLLRISQLQKFCETKTTIMVVYRRGYLQRNRHTKSVPCPLLCFDYKLFWVVLESKVLVIRFAETGGLFCKKFN